MLQEPDCLLLNQLHHHVAKYCSNSIETFVGVTNIGQAHVVEQYLLNDEDRHGLAKLRACFHDP